MGNVMAYSGITTKVRAMSAKLLAAEDYDTIAGLGTVTEAIEDADSFVKDVLTADEPPVLEAAVDPAKKKNTKPTK